VVSNGTIVAGSQQITTLARTGDTHMPSFVSGFMNAVKQDYGIAPPNLNYNEVDANTYTGDATPVTPLSTGDLPGRALVWHADTPTLTNSNTCVAEREISGGEIGWRPVVAQSTVAASVEAWISALQNDGAVNPSVVAMAQQIFDFFYNDSGTAPSLFAQAPPIWEEAHLQFCANDSVSSTAEEPNTGDSPSLTLVDQSLMPDLYLYCPAPRRMPSRSPVTSATTQARTSAPRTRAADRRGETDGLNCAHARGRRGPTDHPAPAGCPSARAGDGDGGQVTWWSASRPRS